VGEGEGGKLGLVTLTNGQNPEWKNCCEGSKKGTNAKGIPLMLVMYNVRL